MNESFQTIVEKEKKDLKQISATEFVEENLKTIFAYVLSRVSNKSDAEDLTNDIVLAILQSADKMKNPNAFYGYVWGIAANTYRKFMRRKSYYSFGEIDENMSDGLDFTSKILLQEDISRLRREIALLSKEYRNCTIAYYFDELSCAEISNKFNISLEMVKYYLFKTRKILKEGISMEREFGYSSFAGYARIDENFYASAVDFNVLPEKNRYFQSVDCTAFKEKIYKTISGKMEPEFMILTEMKEKKLFEILSEEISMMAELYNQLFFCACQIMHVHAPKNVGGQIDRIVFQTLFFRTVGLIGGCAIKSDAFTLPDFDGPVAFYVRENTKEKEESMNQNVLYV